MPFFLLSQCFFTNKSVYLFYKSHENNTNKIKKNLKVFSEIDVKGELGVLKLLNLTNVPQGDLQLKGGN